MLNTFDSGQLAGTAKMSPRNPSLGLDSAAEFSNTSGGIGRSPARRHASMLAGIEPPLATIAIRLHAVPVAISNAPGT